LKRNNIKLEKSSLLYNIKPKDKVNYYKANSATMIIVYKYHKLLKNKIKSVILTIGERYYER